MNNGGFFTPFSRGNRRTNPGATPETQQQK